MSAPSGPRYGDLVVDRRPVLGERRDRTGSIVTVRGPAEAVVRWHGGLNRESACVLVSIGRGQWTVAS